jgi:hypothetical protein
LPTIITKRIPQQLKEKCMLCSLFAKITEKYNDLKEKIYKAKRKMHQYFHINARGRRKKKKKTLILI